MIISPKTSLQKTGHGCGVASIGRMIAAFKGGGVGVCGGS